MSKKKKVDSGSGKAVEMRTTPGMDSEKTSIASMKIMK